MSDESIIAVDPRELLAESRDELERADGKASMLLAAVAVVLGVLGAALLAGDWSPSRLDTGFRVLWWIGVVIAFAGVLALCMAVWPRVKHRLEPGSSLYYDQIALLGTVEKVREAIARADAEERTVSQLLVISKIARGKYLWLRWGMRLLGIATALIIVAMAVGK
jgi:MFS family permease